MTAPKPPEQEHPPGPAPGNPARLARAGRVRLPGAVVRSGGPIPSGLPATPLDRGSAMAAARVRERVRLPGSGPGAARRGNPVRLARARRVRLPGLGGAVVQSVGAVRLGLPATSAEQRSAKRARDWVRLPVFEAGAACSGQPVPLARGVLIGAPGAGGVAGRFGLFVSVCLSGGL